MCELRPARAEEAPALRLLVRTAYAHYVLRLEREPAPMLDDYAARIADCQASVLEAEGALQGVAVLEDSETGLFLENIMVAPSAQGKGLGRQMLTWIEAEGRRRGHQRLWLYTHEVMAENIAMYQRMGFGEAHRAEEAGYRRVFFEKSL
ncbi:MAG: GNAT family N-acetyltransferase [Alphaproteobacteria bacterium]|nr:GNAT family N-acetyltransferase [Alphaproteobacteria bacterium]